MHGKKLNTHKNLVDGRGNTFKVQEELLSMGCKVEINSTYEEIACLDGARRGDNSGRRALQTNLHEVNIEKVFRYSLTSQCNLSALLGPV